MAALNPLRNRLARQRALRTPLYRGRVAGTLSGLAACRCQPNHALGGTHPMRLRGYRTVRVREAVRRTLSGLGATPGPGETLALIPVSDRSAIANAIRMFQARGTASSNIGGLGSTESVTGAAGGAATGAELGSMILPGIGTVIGAFVGAVVGWLSGKSKPVRPTAEQIAACQTLLSEYSGYASQSPIDVLPMDMAQLKNINWCLQALYGSDIKNKDPRFFDGSFNDLLAIAKNIAKGIYETPVGETVHISETVNKVRGQTFRSSGISFTNKQFVGIKAFAENEFLQVAIQYCEQTAGKGRGGCSGLYNRPEYRRWLMDLFGFAAREVLPNISEADLKASSVIATETGTSASDVVKAVEQVIKRNVARGETSALLTGQTDVPGVITPAPAPPGTTPVPPTLPGVTPQSAADITALIAQLVAQGKQSAEVTQTAIDALTSRGVAPTPAIKTAVEKEVNAQSPNLTPWLLGGGAALAFVLLAMPTGKRGRSRLRI